MAEIKQGPITVQEFQMVQEYGKTNDIGIAVRLLAGRTGLAPADIEALDMVGYQRLLSQMVGVFSRLMEQASAILAAERLLGQQDES